MPFYTLARYRLHLLVVGLIVPLGADTTGQLFHWVLESVSLRQIYLFIPASAVIAAGGGGRRRAVLGQSVALAAHVWF